MARPEKKRSRGTRPTAAPEREALEKPPSAVPLPGYLKYLQVGVILLFVVACAHGVLEVHSSTDTWIGLAAGRAIFSEPEFPVADTFSYTFNGDTWFNQNWLSHVYFWILYDYIGPDWVVYGTWFLGAITFVSVLLATRLRCGSWFAATLAAAVVAFATRDWLSARPATTQFACISVLWLALMALWSQGERRRWWPLLIILLDFLAWTHAHGSFIFGYMLIVMFLGCALLPWIARGIWGRQLDIQPGTALWQLGVVVALALVTAVLGIVLSPYGVDNFTHPLLVTESKVFRQVSEWRPPYLSANFPHVGRFWTAFGIAVAAPVIALILLAVDRATLAGAGAQNKRRSVRPWYLGAELTLFDIAAVAGGLYMVMFARRFAPIFYILSTPALVAWIMLIVRRMSAQMRLMARAGLVFAACIAAVALGKWTFQLARHELYTINPPDRHYNLLERVTRFDHTPQEALEFISHNKLSVNVMAEWTQAGLIMFFAPTAKVFIDGRSQQVYDEKHYLLYTALLNFPPEHESKVVELLASKGTEMVLLRRTPATMRLMNAVAHAKDWHIIYRSQYAFMFVQRDGRFEQTLAMRERAGDLWWPDTPEGLAARGRLLVTTEPAETVRGAALGMAAIERKPEVGLAGYAWICGAMLRDARADEALEYLRTERARLATRPPDMRQDVHAALLKEIARCEQYVGNWKAAQRRGTAPARQP